MVDIAQISFSQEGGAGIVARDTELALGNLGINSELHFHHPSTLRDMPFYDPKVTFLSVIDEFLVKRADAETMLTLYRNRANWRPDVANKNVVHLHWWQGIDIEALQKQNPNALFVFTLHDDRAMTGGCHSVGPCTGFKTNCDACPIVRPPWRRNVESSFQDSRRNYSKIENVTFIATSEIMRERAIEAGLNYFGAVQRLNNPVSRVYTFASGQVPNSLPVQNLEREYRFGFVASNVEDRNKRLDLAIGLVQNFISSGRKARLDIVGGGKDSLRQDGVQKHGRLGSSELLKLANTWDAILLPSDRENTPLVIAEMACLGVPTITHLSDTVSETLELSSQKSVFDEQLDWTKRESVTMIANILDSLTPQNKEKMMSYARLNFNAESYAKNLLQIYKRGIEQS